MKILLLACAAVLVPAAPAIAQAPPGSGTSEAEGAGPELAFAGALRGCERWVLDPASFVDGPAPFLAAMALGDRVSALSEAPTWALPPEALREGNRVWRIEAAPTAGFVLTVSDTLPMCHIAGGGRDDLRAGVASVLRSPDFAARWDAAERFEQGGIATRVFRSREEPDFALTLSEPIGEAGPVQVLATAVLQP